jgi:uncharacterized protein (DUF2141 family)
MRVSIGSILLFLCFGIHAQSVTLHFSNIRSTAGFLQIQFYDSEEHFKKEQALFTKLVAKGQVKDGKLTVSYSGLKAGIYGVAILDDENSNKKMDYGLVLPTEGFGFSNYYHTGMTRPTFSDFSFMLGAEKKEIQIKVRYL